LLLVSNPERNLELIQRGAFAAIMEIVVSLFAFAFRSSGVEIASLLGFSYSAVLLLYHEVYIR
jgi:hypothetical protein